MTANLANYFQRGGHPNWLTRIKKSSVLIVALHLPSLVQSRSFMLPAAIPMIPSAALAAVRLARLKEAVRPAVSAGV
jgi:hypothetical protein